MRAIYFKSFVCVLVLGFLLSLSSCKTLMKCQSRKKPPYALIDKQITSVSRSMTNLLKIEDPDLGIFIKRPFILKQLRYCVDSINKDNWKNKYVDSVKIDFEDDMLGFSKELIHISPSVKFFVNGKISYIEDFTVKFSAYAVPSCSNDTLYLFPDFDALQMTKISGKKLWKNYGIKKNIVRNLVLAAFINELNRRFTNSPISIPINLEIYKAQALDKLFASDANQRIISKDSIKLHMSLKNFATHIDSSGIYLIADVSSASKPIELAFTETQTAEMDKLYVISSKEEYSALKKHSQTAAQRGVLNNSINGALQNKNNNWKRPLFYTGTFITLAEQTSARRIHARQDPKSELDSILISLVRRHIDSVNAKNKRLNDILVLYKLNYDSLWSANFDSPAGQNFWIEIKKNFVAGMFNNTLNKINFEIEAGLNTKLEYEKKNIAVGHIDIVNNCAQLRDRACSRRSCNINWGCCGCKWYRPWCCACEGGEAVARAACNALGSVEYGICKAGHYAEFLWCETKIIGAKLINELAKVGDVKLNVNAGGTMRLKYGSFKINSNLDSFQLRSSIKGAANANLKLDYDVKGLIGYLLCPGSVLTGGHVKLDKDFVITAAPQGFDFDGKIECRNETNLVSMKISSKPEDVFLVVTPPPVLALVSDPKFVLQCPLTVLGISLGSFYCAIFKDGDLQKNAIAGLTGLYNYKFKEMSFQFNFDPIEIKATRYSEKINLNPIWANKGIVFNAN